MTHKTDTPTSDEALLSGLYIVATPIGNLGDITMRSVDVLSRCDAVACEDTRVTGKLMKHLGLSKQLWRYNDYSEERDRKRMVQAMHDQAIVLVSDAGTPLISDPGYRLVQDAREAGIMVTSLPGACAAVVGLTMSGLPNDKFLFSGFLPSKEQARAKALESVAETDATLVFYETGRRLIKSLEAIRTVLPGRIVSVARELTKIFEECRTDTPEALIEHYSANPAKGEIVLMVGPPIETHFGEEEADTLLRAALEEDKPSQAAGKVAKATGLDRKTLYARALELREK